MPISFVKGDLFDAAAAQSGARALAFGADCAGTMDAGIAVAFRQRWPALADAFRSHCEGGKMQLGDIFTWKDGDVVVYALGLHRGTTKPKISTFEHAVMALVARAAADGIHRVFLPRIGAGKNGMDWVRVKRVLTQIGKGSPIDFVAYEQFVRSGEPGTGGESGPTGNAD